MKALDLECLPSLDPSRHRHLEGGSIELDPKEITGARTLGHSDLV